MLAYNMNMRKERDLYESKLKKAGADIIVDSVKDLENFKSDLTKRNYF